MEKIRFAIIGGGVAGLTAAIGLRKLGHEAIVYERAKELKGIGAGFGLAANAMQAFEYLGLREGVEKIGHFLHSYNILDEKGRILVAPDTKEISNNYSQKNFAIHRGDLHQFLIHQLPQESIRLGKEATTLEKDANKVRVFFSNGETVEAAALIIADGVKSTLRQFLIPASTPRYAGYTCWRAIIDNSKINLQSSTETWGAAGRFGMTPLVGDKIYWYACINSRPNHITYSKYRIDDLQQHFAHYHAPIPQILAETQDKQLIWNDIVDIKPLTSIAYGRVLLIGDAGHATTPNLGQGACQAIEDVAVMVDELTRTEDIVKAFKHINKRRIQRTRYITNTSWRIGKVAQWESPYWIKARNILMQILPERLKQYQLNKLLHEDFMSTNAVHDVFSNHIET